MKVVAGAVVFAVTFALYLYLIAKTFLRDIDIPWGLPLALAALFGGGFLAAWLAFGR